MEPFFDNYSDLLSIERFLSDIDVSVSRGDILQIFKSNCDIKKINMLDIVNIFNNWNLDPIPLRLSPDILDSINCPLLAFYTSPLWSNFIVINKISPKMVMYYAPVVGDTAESFETFYMRCSKLAIVANSAKFVYEISTEVSHKREYIKNHIRVLDDFLTSKECDYIINYAENNNLFATSQILRLKNNVQDQIDSKKRTSFSATLRERSDPIMKSIYQKVCNMLKVKNICIEDLQCVRYLANQEFKPHYDAGDAYKRVHTFFIYLNDDFTKGETYFPEINLKISPKKGRALYFLNLNSNNQVIPYSLHAGLPVEFGTKYGCNIWVRDCR